MRFDFVGLHRILVWSLLFTATLIVSAVAFFLVVCLLLPVGEPEIMSLRDALAVTFALSYAAFFSWQFFLWQDRRIVFLFSGLS